MNVTRHYFLRALFSVLAVAVLGGYLFGPQEIAERFDTMALGLLGLAALPWLGALVEEFKVGGVEAKLRALQEETEEAVDAAADAREVAEELALTRHIPADYNPMPPASPAPAPVPLDADSFSLPPQPDLAGMSDDFADVFEDKTPTMISPERPDHDDPLKRLELMSADYVQTRASMPSGAARTARMTSIFADMQAAAGKLGGDHKGIEGWLRSDDAGQQLAAIAWLRSFPAAVAPASYVRLIADATQPFVQYWGLRALSGRLSALGLEEFSISDRVALKEIESLMRAGTDRHAQVRRINRKLAGRTPARGD